MVSFFRDVKEHMAKNLEGKSFKEQKEILRKMQTGELKYFKENGFRKAAMVRDKRKNYK